MTFVLIIGRTHYAIVSERPLICLYQTPGQPVDHDLAIVEFDVRVIEGNGDPLAVARTTHIGGHPGYDQRSGHWSASFPNTEMWYSHTQNAVQTQRII